MRTNLDLNEALLKQAAQATGITTKTHLVEEGLRALVRKAAYVHLANLAGTMKGLKAAPRRRF